MRERLLFIYNPNAGKAKLKGKLSDIVVEFSENGYEVIVMPTTKRGDATEFAQEYAKEGTCSRIVCAGGDGTLNEVVTGVMKSGRRIPIGYIPAGTTNDFGYSLKIPKDAIEAAKFAALTDPLPSDVGEICGSTFVYTAAFGLFSDVSYDTSQDMKNILGRVAYLLRGVKSLVEVQNYGLKVKYLEAAEDGGESPAGNVQGQVGNTQIGTDAQGQAGNTQAGTDVQGQAGNTQAGTDVQGQTGNTQAGTDAQGQSGNIQAGTDVQGQSGNIQAGTDAQDQSENVQERMNAQGQAENVQERMNAQWQAENALAGTDAQVDAGIGKGCLKSVEGEFICGMVANSNSVGGFKGIMGKDVRFDDGIFEMLLIRRPRNVIELTEIVNELIGKRLKSDNIVYAHVREVEIKADGELPWSLDGEFGGDMPQAKIHIRQQAVDYIRQEAE